MSKRRTKHIEAYNTGGSGNLVINHDTKQWLWCNLSVRDLAESIEKPKGGLPLAELTSKRKHYRRICL